MDDPATRLANMAERFPPDSAEHRELMALAEMAREVADDRDALREALQVAEAFISVAMPHYAKERAEAVDEILPLIRAELKGGTP